MQYIVADLEWNGSYSKKAHGYFNEIIEIGAVRLSDKLEIEDHFDAVIRPRVSRKLSHWVTDLTGYTDEQLKGYFDKHKHEFIKTDYISFSFKSSNTDTEAAKAESKAFSDISS